MQAAGVMRLLRVWEHSARLDTGERLAEETEASLVQCKIDTVTMQWGTTVKWQRRWMLGHGLRLWAEFMQCVRAEVALRTVTLRMLSCMVNGICARPH